MCQSCYNNINDEYTNDYTNDYTNEYMNEYMYDHRFDNDSLPDLISPSDNDSLPDLEPPSDDEMPSLISHDNSDYIDIDILINRYSHEECPEDDTYENDEE